MKCTIPEISWHNRDPVLSIDVQPKHVDNRQRLASCGTDTLVLIWSLMESNNTADGVTFEVLSELTRHQRAVNVVRWSPNAELLASGDDESIIIIWSMQTYPGNRVYHDSQEEKWNSIKILKGHTEDVYDLSWEPNNLFLLSASVDNTSIVWDISKGRISTILQESQGFIQGVAWDPKNQFFVTLSSDRVLRTYNAGTRKMISKSSKCILPVPSTHSLFGESCRLYHDDTLQTFYRRCSFSPDGALLVAPAGILDGANQYATYIYARNMWKQPTVVLPSDQYTIGARFCPILYELRETNTKVFNLPYRMVFAVATKSSVYLYDTQQKAPIAIISNIHYTRLTDLSWSADGRMLIVSSTDGFCSFIKFEKDDLGTVYDSSKSVRPTKLVVQQLLMGQNKSDAPKLNVPIDIILSVDEKFPSPVKHKPATPIAVRRKPRDYFTTERKEATERIRSAENEATQDILLTVEDELKPEVQAEQKRITTESGSPSVSQCTTSKVPRRVSFKTISTPKRKMFESKNPVE